MTGAESAPSGQVVQTVSLDDALAEARAEVASLRAELAIANKLVEYERSVKVACAAERDQALQRVQQAEQKAEDLDSAFLNQRELRLVAQERAEKAEAAQDRLRAALEQALWWWGDNKPVPWVVAARAALDNLTAPGAVKET